MRGSTWAVPMTQMSVGRLAGRELLLETAAVISPLRGTHRRSVKDRVVDCVRQVFLHYYMMNRHTDMAVLAMRCSSDPQFDRCRMASSFGTSGMSLK